MGREKAREKGGVGIVLQQMGVEGMTGRWGRVGGDNGEAFLSCTDDRGGRGEEGREIEGQKEGWEGKDGWRERGMPRLDGRGSIDTCKKEGK